MSSHVMIGRYANCGSVFGVAAVRGVVAIVVGYAVATAARASAAPPVREQSEARFLLEGVLSCREQLHSGVFHTKSGQVTVKSKRDPNDDFGGELILFGALDGDSVRFDRTAPGWVVDKETMKVDTGPNQFQAAGKRGVIAEKYFRTLERSGYWRADSDRVAIRRPDLPPMGQVQPFDVRVLGLCSLSDLESGISVKQAIQRMSDSHCEAVVESLADGMMQFVLYTPNRDAAAGALKLLIDTQRGFSPTRFEALACTGKEREWATYNVCEVTWEQQNTVWVPAEVTWTQQPFPRTSERRLQLSLAWDSVNEKIDKTLFSVESFGAPESVEIVDDSLGSPVVVKYANTPSPGRALAADAGWRWWIIGAVCLGITCFALVVRARQRAA